MSHLLHKPTMQPTLVDTPPTGSGWLHEVKYDGYRTQLAIKSGRVIAYSRSGHDWTGKYGPIITAAKSLPVKSALIDGEMCVQDHRGVTDFGALPGAIARAPARLIFFAFDLLHPDGQDLAGEPLETRRAKLRGILDQVPGKRIVMSDEFEGDARAFFAAADRHGLEGIVSKRKGSRYRGGATRDWLKIKCWATDEFSVIGVERDKDGVPHALLADENGYRGAAYVTLPGDLRSDFWRYIEGQATERPTVVGLKKRAIWVSRGMTAKVRFLKGVTSYGMRWSRIS